MIWSIGAGEGCWYTILPKFQLWPRGERSMGSSFIQPAGNLSICISTFIADGVTKRQHQAWNTPKGKQRESSYWQTCITHTHWESIQKAGFQSEKERNILYRKLQRFIVQKWKTGKMFANFGFSSCVCKTQITLKCLRNTWPIGI